MTITAANQVPTIPAGAVRHRVSLDAHSFTANTWQTIKSAVSGVRLVPEFVALFNAGAGNGRWDFGYSSGSTSTVLYADVAGFVAGGSPCGLSYGSAAGDPLDLRVNISGNVSGVVIVAEVPA